MKTDTDKIRAAFERDQKNQPTDLEKDNEGYYLDTFTIGLFRIYERAYKQGQRDLIEEMEISAYQSPKKENKIWPKAVFRMLKGAQQDQESWIPLYRLPEDAPK